MLSGNEIKNLAMTIEEELYNLFLDTGHKYRTKYRSLVFNIKDSKNKGLFRKILTGKIKPYKLVQMSTEELASRELAKWREKESKHQLEMIEQTEKEALKESMGSKHVRKKTHKGEIEVEEEDLSILEARLDEKVDKTNEAPEELIQVPVIDTTDQHRAHLFDLNCKVCTGKIVPGPEEQQQAASSTKKVTFSFEASTTKIISDDEQSAEPDDFAKAEEIVKEAMRTVQKTSEAISSYSPPPDVSDSPPETNMPESPPPESTSLLSMTSSPKHDSVSSSSSSLDMTKVVVRSPDSALQSGLELKAKFVPTGPLLWKGCISMLDVAKFFTSAYRVSGPFENITIPDTIHIMGRISPDHMWDYLSKIRQAGSKDLTVVRFIPGNDDEKVAYVHLYSYLNSRSRCGVAGSDNSKQIKDFYVIPLASHSKIPRTLLPFDGPGLEENRPHMLIGIIVKQRGKHSSSSDSPSIGNGSSKSKSKSSTSSSSSSSSSSTSGSNSKHHSSDKPSSGSSSSSSKHKSSSSSKDKKPVIVNRDPRLAKLAAAAAAAKPASSASPTDSTSSAGSSHNSSTGTPNTEAVASPSSSSTSAPSKTYGGDPRKAAKKALEEKKEQEAGGGDDIYEPEYVPMPVKSKAQPVAEYVPTAKSTKDKEMDSGESQPNRHQHHHLHHDGHHHDHHHHHQHQHHHHHPPHHHHHHHQHKSQDQEDDSEPYSPGKEAEPYSPSQEAQADEPYDPGDETLMDDSGVPLAPTQQPETATSSSSSSSTSSSLSTLSTTASIKTTTSSSSSLSSSNTLMTATTTTTTTTMDKSSASAPVTSTTTTSHPKQESTQPLSGAITTTAAATTLGEVGKKNKKDGNTEDSSLKASDPVAKGEDSPFCINDCVEKMARSNNPTEISSLMVTALSTASSPEEQQKLLVDLTKRVEERKLQLANLSRTSGATFAVSAGSSTSANASGLDKLGLEANVANISKSADSTTNGKDLSEEVSKIPSPVEDITKDAAGPDSSSSSSSSLSGKQQPKAFGFSFLKTSSKTPPLLTTTSADIFTSDSAKTSPDVDKPLNVPGLESAAAGVEEEKQSASKPQIPHALKALMDDVLGNTQSLHGEKRMKHMIKKETDKEEKRKKEREEEEEGKNEEQQSEKTEAEKRLEDEMEARKILEGLNESEKAIGLPGGGKKEKIETPQSSSSVEEAADVTTDNTKKDKVPTIDELLEKLKKGGFQFPVATAEKTTTASASDDIITPEASSSTSDVSSTTNSTSASTTLPLLMGNLDNQDVDLRTMSGTPPLLSTVTSSMGMTENPTPADTIAACLASLPKNTAMSTSSSSISPPHVPSTTDSMLEVQDIDHRKSQPFASSSASSSPPPNTAIDKDDHFKSTSSVSFYEEDKDDRIFQSLPHAGRPKHPLDPRAFPPLPGDSSRGGGVYPPPHHPSRPSPRFPLPKTGRAQPPPPGTEFESTTMTTGRTASDLPVSDIDMRSGSGSGGHPHHRGGGVPIPPPLPPEQVPPPLPPQPPPPLPPLPGNRGVGDLHHHHHLHHPAPPLPPAPYQDYPPPASNPGYSHLPPSDIDFRGHHHHHEHHPHLPPHHHPQQPQQHHPHHGGSSHHHQHHHHHHPSSSSSSSSSHHPPPSSSSHHSDKPWYQDRGGERGDRNRRDQDYHRRGGGGYSRGGRRH